MHKTEKKPYPLDVDIYQANKILFKKKIKIIQLILEKKGFFQIITY